MLVNEVWWAASGYNPVTQKYTPVPAKIVVVLDSPSKVEEVFLPEMQKWHPLKPNMLHKKGKPFISEVQWPNGSVARFLFHMQEELAAESIEWQYAFFDEPPSRRLFIAIKRGGRSKQMLGKVLMIGTPLSQSWLRTDVYEPWSKGLRQNTECFRFSTYVNRKNLADGYLEDFENVLSEKERRIRLEGEFFDLEGLALAHLWKREKHVVPPFEVPAEWPRIIVCDFHPRKHHIAVLFAVSPDDEVYIVDEWASRAIPSEYAELMYQRWGAERIVDILCDSLGNAELTGGYGNMSFIGVCNKVWLEEDYGWRMRATSYDEKNDERWIAMIQEFLAIPIEPDNLGRREPKLKVFSTCKGSIFDLENVEWYRQRNTEDLKPKLDMTKRDYLSCLKYGLAARPTYTMNRTRVVKSRPSPWSGSAGSHIERGQARRRANDRFDEEF